jgi:hypothetical protein
MLLSILQVMTAEQWARLPTEAFAGKKGTKKSLVKP